MNFLGRARVPIVVMLVLCSTLALGGTVLVSPSYAQLGVQSNSHSQTHTEIHGPPASQGASTTTTSSVSNGGNRNGRSGKGVPPGLVNAWAHSNMSVVARAVTHAIFLNGIHGTELAEIAIAASSNNQIIRNVAFNETVAQVDFDHDGAVELDINSSSRPSAVFADDNELTEAQWNIGLTPNSNVWVYDENSHKLSIYADPSSITIFYGSTPTPVPEFPAALAAVVLLLGLSGAFLAAKVSKRPKGFRR